MGKGIDRDEKKKVVPANKTEKKRVASAGSVEKKKIVVRLKKSEAPAAPVASAAEVVIGEEQKLLVKLDKIISKMLKRDAETVLYSLEEADTQAKLILEGIVADCATMVDEIEYLIIPEHGMPKQQSRAACMPPMDYITLALLAIQKNYEKISHLSERLQGDEAGCVKHIKQNTATLNRFIEEKMPRCNELKRQLELGKVLFSQPRANTSTSVPEGGKDDSLSNALVTTLALELKTRVLDPSQFRVVISLGEGGELVSQNNRGLAALTLAGIAPDRVIPIMYPKSSVTNRAQDSEKCRINYKECINSNYLCYSLDEFKERLSQSFYPFSCMVLTPGAMESPMVLMAVMPGCKYDEAQLSKFDRRLRMCLRGGDFRPVTTPAMVGDASSIVVDECLAPVTALRVSPSMFPAPAPALFFAARDPILHAAGIHASSSKVSVTTTLLPAPRDKTTRSCDVPLGFSPKRRKARDTDSLLSSRERELEDARTIKGFPRSKTQ